MKSILMKDAIELVEKAAFVSQEERTELQRERLRELIDYARNNSPYINSKYKNLKEDYSLEDIPASNKKEVMEHYNDWVTDREVSLNSVMEYLDSEDRIRSLYLGKYSALTTSGSTGNPFVMIRDAYHNTIHGALMAKRLMKDDSGLLDLSKNKIACLIYTDPHVSSYSSLLRTKEAQKEYADNIIAISPLLPKSEIVRQLNDFNPSVVTCYPVIMSQIAEEKAKGQLKINLKAIFCSAELLTEEMYNYLKDTFECPVYNNYCSTEGGEAAMASGCSNLHINEDWVIIEPVDEKGNIISSEDEWSKGVLVTDLSNYIQPVIRYRMDDCVRIRRNCKCGNPLPYLEIHGRDTGTMHFAGKDIVAVNFIYVIEKRLGTFSVQFIQLDNNTMEIRSLLADKEDYLNQVAEIVKEMLDGEGCKDYSIIISDEAPKRNERGGKTPNFIKV